MIRYLFSLAFTLLLIAATLWVVGFIWFIGEVPREPLDDAQKPKAELGVALTGANGRIMHGLIMLYEERIDQLFITGVNENVTDEELFLSLGNQLGPKLYSVYKDKIFIGRAARSTRGNALETRKFLQDQNRIYTMLLITSNYHMPRSMHEFKRVLKDSITIHPEPNFSPDFPMEWWRKKQAILLMISEYHKTVISFLAKYVAQETQLNEFLANNPL